jgi:DNA-binding MarR family transcriptional regulator
MTERLLDQLGVLTLGSRLRRITDCIYLQADAVYRHAGTDFQAAWFPVIFLLADQGVMGVKALAEQSRQTHSAVSQLLSKLTARGYVEKVSNRDRRRSDFQLTEAGEALVVKLQPVWGVFIEALDLMLSHSSHDLMAAIADFEQQLIPDGLLKNSLTALS